MKSNTEFTATIEIELYYSESEEQPDTLYCYANDLLNLLELCSERYLKKCKQMYQAEKVKVGKIELVSLTQDKGLPIQDGIQKIELSKKGIIETKNMRA